MATHCVSKRIGRRGKKINRREAVVTLELSRKRRGITIPCFSRRRGVMATLCFYRRKEWMALLPLSNGGEDLSRNNRERREATNTHGGGLPSSLEEGRGWPSLPSRMRERASLKREEREEKGRMSEGVATPSSASLGEGRGWPPLPCRMRERASLKRGERRGGTNGRGDCHTLNLVNVSRGLPLPASLEGRRREKGRDAKER